jgi:hypothetical protein
MFLDCDERSGLHILDQQHCLHTHSSRAQHELPLNADDGTERGHAFPDIHHNQENMAPQNSFQKARSQRVTSPRLKRLTSRGCDCIGTNPSV